MDDDPTPDDFRGWTFRLGTGSVQDATVPSRPWMRSVVTLEARRGTQVYDTTGDTPADAFASFVKNVGRC